MSGSALGARGGGRGFLGMGRGSTHSNYNSRSNNLSRGWGLEDSGVLEMVQGRGLELGRGLGLVGIKLRRRRPLLSDRLSSNKANNLNRKTRVGLICFITQRPLLRDLSLFPLPHRARSR